MVGGRDIVMNKFHKIWHDYCVNTRRTRGDITVEQAIDNCILGLVGEVGEIFDGIKKQRYHASKKKSAQDFQDYMDLEVGDVLWYVAWLSDMDMFDRSFLMLSDSDTMPSRDGGVLFSILSFPDLTLKSLYESLTATLLCVSEVAHRFPKDHHTSATESFKGVRIYPEKLFRSLSSFSNAENNTPASKVDKKYLAGCMEKNLAKLQARHPDKFT